MTGWGCGGDIDTHADQPWNGDPETAPDNEEPPLCPFCSGQGYHLIGGLKEPCQDCDATGIANERAADAEHHNQTGDE